MGENVEQPKNNKPAPEASWQKWEHVVHEVLGSASGRLGDKDVEKRGNANDKSRGDAGFEAGSAGEYFDKAGKKVLNPKDLPANEPILRVESDASGNRTVKVFGDKAGLQQNKELFSEKFSYSQDGNKTIEDRKIQAAGAADTHLQTVFDKDSSAISFRVKTNGLNQEISLDGNSNLQKFEMSYGKNSLAYQIEEGKIVGVKLTGPDGMERPISEKKANEFIQAGREAVSSLRENNGIPEPLGDDSSRKIKSDLEVAGKDTAVQLRLDRAEKLNATEFRGDLAGGASTRRAAISPEMFKSLLAEAKSNEVAKSILRDLASPNYFESDPLSHAISSLKELHPEKSKALSDAAIDAVAKNSRNPLYAELAKAAVDDPQFGKTLREIIASDLQSKRQDEKGPAVEMLMSLSPQWTSADFNAALRNMQPEQVQSFRAALSAAPDQIREEAVHIAIAKNGEQDFDLLSGKRPVQSNFGAPTAQSEKEFQSVQDRMRLIVGRSESGAPLMQLPLGTSLPSTFDRGSVGREFGATHQPSLLDFSVPGYNDNRAMESARNLFRSAFPGHDMEHPRTVKPVDERYLADALDCGIARGASSRRTSEQVFSKWGVDSAKYSGEIQGAKQQYGEDALLALDRRVQMFNALDPSLRERLAGTGNNGRIDEGQLAGLVLNGRLGHEESPYRFLLDTPPLEQKLAQETRDVSSDLSEIRLDLNSKREAKNVSLELLSQYTTNGVGAGALVQHGLDKLFETGVSISTFGLAPETGLFTSGVEAFAQKQRELVNEFRSNDQAFKDKMHENSQVAASDAQLRFAKTVLDYESLSQSDASQTRKDYMALALVDSYGIDAIKEKAPRVWQDLQDGGLKRLLDQHLIQSDKFGEISGNRGEKLKQAFDITDTLEKRDASGNLDLGIRRRQALDVIDNDASLIAAQKQFANFGEEFATFSKLFESANEGTKYDAIVKDLKTQAKDLEQALGQIKKEDLNNLIDLQIKTDAASKSATDPETKQALAERAASMKGVLDLLNPESPQNQSLLKTLRDAQTRSFSEDTLGTWLKENGPIIAAASVSVAVTMASMGTAAPVAMVLMSSAVALGATQLTSEALYQINHRLIDTGLGAYDSRSYAGAWASNNAETFNRLLAAQDWKGTTAEARKLVESYVKEVSMPLTAEYAQNVVMGLIGLGALKIGQSGLSGMNSQWVKSLVSNPQSLEMIEMAAKSGASSSSKAAASAWMRQIAHESVKEIGEEVGQDGVTTVAEKALQQAKLNSPAASVLLAVSMGMASGRMGARHNAKFNGDNDLQIHSSMKDNVIEHLKNSGHHVEQLSDGSYAVSKFNHPGSQLRISVSNDVPTRVAARQHSRHGLGTENATDVKIQDLAGRLEGASPEQAAQLKGEIKQLLVEQSKQYAAKLGLVVRDANNNIVDYLVKDKNIRLTDDGTADSYGTDNTIEISLNRADPTSALFHEMKHMSEMIERTSLQKADPAGFDRRVREDVFGEMAQGGRSRIAVVDGELQTVSRTELKTAEQRNALRSLLMEYSETNPSSKPEQIADWLQSKQDRVAALSKAGLDSSAVADLMSAEMFHYQSVKRQAQLDSDVLQNDATLDKWTDARAEKYRSMAENRKDSVYDEPQLQKLTRGITEEALGTMGDTEHYNVFGPSERRAEVVELTNAIRSMQADADSRAAIDGNVSVIQLSANLQKLTSSLAKMRTSADGDPQAMKAAHDSAMKDAHDSALKVLDKLPENELGKRVVARLVEMNVIDASEAPAALRPVDSAQAHSRSRTEAGASDTTSDIATRRLHSQSDTFAQQQQKAVVKVERAGQSSAEDLNLMREYETKWLPRKKELDEFYPLSPEQEVEYDKVMKKVDEYKALRADTDKMVAHLAAVETHSQSELNDTTQSGFCTQKMVTPWIADLFKGDPRYKVVAGGATSDHLHLDIALLDTKTGQYIPIDVKQYDPAEIRRNPLPSIVRLAKSDPNDPRLSKLRGSTAEEDRMERQQLFFQDLAGISDDRVSLSASKDYARRSLLQSLQSSPLTVLHNPLDLNNHLSSHNMKQGIDKTIDGIGAIPDARYKRGCALELKAGLEEQKKSVVASIAHLDAQAARTGNAQVREMANALRYKVRDGGYFDTRIKRLERIANPESSGTIVTPASTPNRNNSGGGGGSGPGGTDWSRRRAAGPRRY